MATRYFCSACMRDAVLGKPCSFCGGNVLSEIPNTEPLPSASVAVLAQSVLATWAPEKVTRLERIVIALISAPHRQWDAQAELQEGYAWAVVHRAKEFLQLMDRIEPERSDET